METLVLLVRQACRNSNPQGTKPVFLMGTAFGAGNDAHTIPPFSWHSIRKREGFMQSHLTSSCVIFLAFPQIVVYTIEKG